MNEAARVFVVGYHQPSGRFVRRRFATIRQAMLFTYRYLNRTYDAVAISDEYSNPDKLENGPDKVKIPLGTMYVVRYVKRSGRMCDDFYFDTDKMTEFIDRFLLHHKGASCTVLYRGILTY